MIDPDKPTEIVQAMQEILTNSELREKLMARGLVQAKKFTWIKPAEDFLKIINKL
jgi:glycosyltransferase involved in cell wall biosynthesis